MPCDAEATSQRPGKSPYRSEEMIRRYTHLRPDFMRDELARVPDFDLKTVTKITKIAPVAPQLTVAV